MNNIKIEYNSTYISANLIDELDFVIGGYGKPNPVFIYSLNTFLEAFILNSSFYLSAQELRHIQIVSKAIFPNGRPILDLLSKTKCLNAIEGIGNDIGQVVSIGKFDVNNMTSYQERIQEYINNGLDTNETREKYLVIPTIVEKISKLSYLNIGRIEDGYIATISYSSPQDFYQKLCKLSSNSNIQATLPIYSFKFQIEEIQTRGLGRDIITKLSDTFLSKQNQINEYFGYTSQTLPPLVVILLSQCKNISEIPVKMLHLREDFTKLRNSIVNYEIRINEANSIKEQLEAIDELNEFWKVLNKKYSENRRFLYQFWEIAEESDYENSIDKAVDARDISGIISDLNIGKVAGKNAKKLFEWYRGKKIINRFRGVTDIWNLFLYAPNVKKHIEEFERVFEVKLDLSELTTLNKWIHEIKLKQ